MKTIRRLPDAEAVSRAAAQDLVKLARAAIADRGRFCVALSGGSTPRRMYEILAEAPRWAQLDWRRVEFFWSDERAVGPEHPESNYGVAASVLLGKVGVMPDRIHRIQGELADPGQAAARYQEELSRVFATPVDGLPPIFDLIFLGMGGDGHTASLFPYSQALTERRRWVVGHTVARIGKARITMTPPILNRAAEIRLLVTGPDKAASLREALEGPREPERLPVQLVAPEAGRLVWLVDRAAAAQLSPDTMRQALRGH
ncbi:MAG TPA: 6-phosphogluconolactonase [Candidatus Limnocylindria bacterium]|nr:6-phosphogluconolactonase [Candidatus Limnocylindria bacterium]